VALKIAFFIFGDGKVTVSLLKSMV